MKLNVERFVLIPCKPFDLARRRDRHTLAGGVKVRDIEDANRASSCPLDKLPATGDAYLANARLQVQAKLARQRLQHVIDRRFLAPNFKVIRLRTRRIEMKAGRWWNRARDRKAREICTEAGPAFGLSKASPTIDAILTRNYSGR